MATWMKFETRVRTHPKIEETIEKTGRCDAAWLWFAGSAYSRDALTDGFIGDRTVATLVPSLPARVLKPLPAVLVSAGLWHRVEGGYQIHDFLHHNPTKAEIEDKREADRTRKRGSFQTDSTRNPVGFPTDSSVSRTRVAPGGASSTSSLSSLEGVQGEPPPAARRVPYGDPHGMRHDPSLAATAYVSEQQRIGIPEKWARQQRERYGLTHDHIDAFATWLAEDVRANGGRVNGPTEGFWTWLDARWGAWRATQKAASTSDAEVQRTDALLAEQAARRANLAPVADVLEGLRAGRRR